MPDDAVAAFCADLNRAVRASGLSLPHLARRLGLDRRLVDDTLAGSIDVPPGWDALVAPLLHACGADPADLELWRRHHARMAAQHDKGPSENAGPFVS